MRVRPSRAKSLQRLRVKEAACSPRTGGSRGSQQVGPSVARLRDTTLARVEEAGGVQAGGLGCSLTRRPWTRLRHTLPLPSSDSPQCSSSPPQAAQAVLQGLFTNCQVGEQTVLPKLQVRKARPGAVSG